MSNSNADYVFMFLSVVRKMPIYPREFEGSYGTFYINDAIFSRTDVPTIYYICGTLMTYPFYIVSVIIGSKIGFNSAYNSLPKED